MVLALKGACQVLSVLHQKQFLSHSPPFHPHCYCHKANAVLFRGPGRWLSLLFPNPSCLPTNLKQHAWSPGLWESENYKWKAKKWYLLEATGRIISIDSLFCPSRQHSELTQIMKLYKVFNFLKNLLMWERETSICFSTHLCIHWLILVCALTEDQTCKLGLLGLLSIQLRYLARANLHFFFFFPS